MEKKDKEPKVIQPAEIWTATIHNQLSNRQKKTPQANAKAIKFHHNEIETDQHTTGEAMLLLGYYDISQIEMITTSHTKIFLLVAYNHIN